MQDYADRVNESSDHASPLRNLFLEPFSPEIDIFGVRSNWGGVSICRINPMWCLAGDQ